MAGEKISTIRTAVFCLILNGILVAFFVESGRIFGGPPTAGVVIAVGAVLTLILWLLISFAGGGGAVEAPKAAARPSPAPPSPAKPSPEPAIQMLAALQREGRLIDFLQEDISSYEDGQIGAAVRNIHSGCRAALQEHLDLQPVFREQEGSAVTIPAGFDSRAVRLTGNVAGNPPFRGILRHRGWQAERVRLPQMAEDKNRWILAPAEVEIE